ncbi:MAG: hypothetical protein SCH70_13245, partial [Candidatus Methanoperedens sp.]|nr:hypothetical protein [Candidatus Methanoperedens sp.]
VGLESIGGKVERIEYFYGGGFGTACPQGIKDWLKLLIMVLMGIFIVSFLIIELKKSLSILVVFIVSLLLG